MHLQQRHITLAMLCIRLCHKGCLAGEELTVKVDVYSDVRGDVICVETNGWS
jgi:hypothetical protein